MKSEPIRPNAADLRALALEAALRGRRGRAKNLDRIAGIVERQGLFGKHDWGVKHGTLGQLYIDHAFVEDQYILALNGALLASLALDMGLRLPPKAKGENKLARAIADLIHSV